jgi:hypothetical protein
LISASLSSATGANTMLDIVYLGLTVALAGLTWGLVKLCERVS